MSDVFQKNSLRQVAVYWPSPVPDGEGGYSYGNPIEIKCRWEDRAERFMGPDGEEHLSQAVVYVDRDLELGGFLVLGTLGDTVATGSDLPSDTPASRPVAQFAKIPNLAGKRYTRTAWL